MNPCSRWPPPSRRSPGTFEGSSFDLKDGPGVLDEMLALLDGHGFDDDRLWFNAAIETVGRRRVPQIAMAYPGAIVQCPVDFLAPLVAAAPRRARRCWRCWPAGGSAASRWPGAAREHPLPGPPARGVGVRGEPLRGARPRVVPPSGAADAPLAHRRLQLPAVELLRAGLGRKRRYHRYPKRQATAAG